jgi:hypothetical protein
MRRCAQDIKLVGYIVFFFCLFLSHFEVLNTTFETGIPDFNLWYPFRIPHYIHTGESMHLIIIPLGLGLAINYEERLKMKLETGESSERAKHKKIDLVLVGGGIMAFVLKRIVHAYCVYGLH